MKKNKNFLAAVAVGAFSVTVLPRVAFADGESITNATLNVYDKSACPYPLGYGDTRAWADGEPADGPGATLTIRINGGAPARGDALNLTRNVTLGHILRPSDDTQDVAFGNTEERDSFLIRWDSSPQESADTYTPTTTRNSKSLRENPYRLTMDSGSDTEPATIQHLIPSETMANRRFGMFIEPPVVLNSDLYLKYIGPSDNTYGTGWTSKQNCHVDGAMYFTGGLSDGKNGAKGVTIDNPVLSIGSSYVYTPIFLGGVSTFTGPVNVTSGMLRLLGEGRFEGDCHGLGANNHIYATSGAGVVDLAGTRAGLDGNTLHLGGTLARTEMGPLINSVPDPLVPGEWAGPIVIESPVKIGGYSQVESSATVGGGDIVLSGPISGTDDIEVINRRELVLAGDNSAFSGNWNLTSGFIRLKGSNPVGQGSLKFTSGVKVKDGNTYPTYGGAYRYGSTDDTDLSTVNYDITNQNLRIDVAAGLEYHPSNGFKGLTCSNRTDTSYVHGVITKTGPGTLRLSEPNEYLGTRDSYHETDWLHINEGEVVLDYSENHGAKLIGAKIANRSGRVCFGENARLTIKGAPDDGIGFYRYVVRPNSFATIRFDDEGTCPAGGYWFGHGDFESGGYGNDTMHGILNFEVDPERWPNIRLADANSRFVDNSLQHDANYPSIRDSREIWNGTTFTYMETGANNTRWLRPVPDSMYVTDFTSTSTDATAPSNSLVDVTAALCAAGTHTNIECAVLRFNTPNGGTPLVLNLSGTNRIHGGTILITPNVGSTPIVIRGGHIIRDPHRETNIYQGYNGLRIVNMNTNATVTIESDVCLDTTNPETHRCRGQLGVYGPGRTVCTGRFDAQGTVCVNGGTLAIGDTQKFLSSRRAPGSQWDCSWLKWRETYLNGGGVLEFTEDCVNAYEVPGDTEVGTYYSQDIGKTFAVTNQWRFHYGVSGGGIGVAKGKTLTLVTPPRWLIEWYYQPGATFIKAGEGTVKFTAQINWQTESKSMGTGGDLSDWVNGFDLRGGTIGHFEKGINNRIFAKWFFFAAKCATVMTARDGTTMVGREFSTTRLANENRPSIDSGNGVRIVIPKGATVTHDRYSGTGDYPGEAKFPSAEYLDSGIRTGGLWAGDGTLVLTNSQGTAMLGWYGFRNRLFTGRIVDHVGVGDPVNSTFNYRYSGTAPNFDKARLDIRSDATWYVGYGMDIAKSLVFHFGGLDGTGGLDCRQRWTTGFESPRIGSDDGETHDFSGFLRIVQNGARYGQFVKVGSNTQRISGTANQLQTSARVVDGTLVLGHLRALDSTDQPNDCNNIYVGGDETTAGMAPRFLVDCGDVTVTNTVKVLGCAGAASPAVGAFAGTVTFRNVTVSNACTFVAEAGATAKFDKITQLGGTYPMSQTGAGTVELTTDFALSDSYALDWGGRLVVDGELTVADGTKFALGSIPAELDPKLRYTLVSATGGITGRFDLSNVTLPSGWVLRQRANKLILYRPSGIAITVK